MIEVLDALRQGFRLVLSPGLRRYVVVPVIINALLYAGVITLLSMHLPAWVDMSVAWLPHWLSWLAWLIWPLTALTLLVIVYFTFSVMVNVLASPFYGVLADRVEQTLTGRSSDDARTLWQQTRDGVHREWQKLRYMLPRLAGLLALGFVPGMQPAMPILWLLFSSWCLAMQYIDFVMDNHGVTFPRMRECLHKARFPTLAFGLVLTPLIWLPIINLVAMPAAVAAGVILWQRHYSRWAVVPSGNGTVPVTRL